MRSAGTFDLKNTIWNCPALIRTKTLHLINISSCPCRPSRPSPYPRGRHNNRSCLSDISYGWPCFSYFQIHDASLQTNKCFQATACVHQPAIPILSRVRQICQHAIPYSPSFCTVKSILCCDKQGTVQYGFQWCHVLHKLMWQLIRILIAIHHEALSHVLKAVKIQDARGLKLTNQFHPICNALLDTIVTKDLTPRLDQCHLWTSNLH